MTSDYLKQYDEIRKKIASYQLALKTLNWDASTVAPKKGANYRNQMGAILAGELFSISTHPDYLHLIETLAQDSSLEPELAREIQQIKKDQDKTKFIPKELYIEYSQLVRDGESLWEEAKEAKDYEQFKPMLKKLVETTQKVIQCRHDTRSVYDQLLDDFEPGFTQKEYDHFFNRLKEDLVPLIHRINSLNQKEPAWLSVEVPVEIQRRLVHRVAQFLDYNLETGLISESAHPFSSGFSSNDNRVTVKYHTNAFTSSLFAVIHEIGHATYNGQVDSKWDGHHISDSMSYGMHESQSRFLENMVGRSKEFWVSLYPFFQTEIPALNEVSLDEFIFGINVVQASLIRIEADELTYPLHILIRYEIEKGLFDGSLSVEGLDQVWADKYEAYLGVRPSHASEGILQDIHWSGAAFGYFPTYALGSAYSAQWMHAMKKELDVEKALTAGDITALKAWLKDNIHQWGGLYKAHELFDRICKEPFNPDYYVSYLTSKFEALYRLK